MDEENVEDFNIEEQIERCHRLAKALTDEQMRTALERLAQDYAARLGRRRGSPDGEGFMLQR